MEAIWLALGGEFQLSGVVLLGQGFKARRAQHLRLPPGHREARRAPRRVGRVGYALPDFPDARSRYPGGAHPSGAGPLGEVTGVEVPLYTKHTLCANFPIR